MAPEDAPESGAEETTSSALPELQRIEWAELPTLIVDKLESWAQTGFSMLPNLVVALLILVVFWLGARGAAHVLGRTLDRVSKNDGVNRLLVITARLSLTAIGLFLALGALNLDGVVTSMLAGVGVVGLALGFAFQDIAANFMSGTIMAISRPFDIGDLIETNGYLGTVESIDMRTVRLRTVQGNRVLLPNKEVYNGALTNFTETPHRRIDLEVGVAYGDDLKLAKEVCEEAISALACTLVERGVDVFYTGFGDSSINFEARFWINFSRQRDFVSARSEAVIAIKQALDANGLHIPFPIRTLDFGARDVGGRELELLGAGVEGRSAS